MTSIKRPGQDMMMILLSIPQKQTFLISIWESQYLCFKTLIQIEISQGLRHLSASFGMKEQDGILGTS